MTKAQIRALTRELLDDPNAVRWGDTNLDLLIEGVADEVWRETLRSAPWATTQLDTIAAADIAAPGYIDLPVKLSKLTRWFKLQLVERNGRHYRSIGPRNVLIENAAELSAQPYRYLLFAEQLWLFPLDTGTQVEVRYSYLPPRYSGLSDANPVVWPDGYESVLYLKSAARALGKGAAEDRRELWEEAETEKQRMLATMAERFSDPPVAIQLYDSAVEWGSE